MTSPLKVIPEDLWSFATDQHGSADDLLSDKPPPYVGDDPDDPTKGGQQDYNDAVQGTTRGFKKRSHRSADAVDTSGHLYSREDQDAAGRIAAVAPGDQAGVLGGTAGDLKGGGGAIGKGLDAAGVGSIMNAFLGPLGQMASGFSQAGLGLVGAGTQGLSTIAGQMTNVVGQLGSAVAKNPGLGVSGGAGGGGALPGETAHAGGGEGEVTKPASASSPLSPSPGSVPDGLGGYVHPRNPDDHTVQSASMGMGGGIPAGLMSGGGSTGSISKVRRHPIITTVGTSMEDDSPTGPISIPIFARASKEDT